MHVATLRKYILPWTTVLSGTVREIKALLDNARVPTSYPRCERDIQLMGDTPRHLGPKYVIIEGEILDAEEHATTFHCVLGRPSGSSLDKSRCDNPSDLFGISYSILVSDLKRFLRQKRH